MDNREKIALHGSWWRRENARPLQAHFAPVKTPHGGLDVSVPASEIGRRKRENAAALAPLAQDLLVVQRVDFGPALLPALAGAGFRDDGHTSWNTPIAERCADLRIPRFDGKHPLWAAYVERREQLLAHWSWDSYLPGHLNSVGPADILAGLLGPENLAIEVCDYPDGVAAALAECAEFWSAVMCDEVAALRTRGPRDGITELFSVWLPGNGVRMVDDFSALVGPTQARELLAPADRRAAAGFDSVLFHTHSAAWRNVPFLAEIGPRVAVEFTTDPSGPNLDTRLSVLRALQKAGHPVQLTSWDVPLTEDEIARAVRSLDPRGLIMRFQTTSADEARKLYDRVLELSACQVRGIHEA